MLSQLLDPGATAVKELADCPVLLEQTFEKVETESSNTHYVRKESDVYHMCAGVDTECWRCCFNQGSPH